MKQPNRYKLPSKDPKTALRDNLVRAINSIPMYFTSPILIQGLAATDLFSVNTLLGGAIEEQTVRILNEMRSIWDPEDQYMDYAFIRFPESFPDVRLVKSNFDTAPLIGIELKGWFLLSKEGEPSFRYKAAADAMTKWDLLVCVPWALSEVISGAPKAYAPYVEQAKYAADMRTYYWNTRNGDAGDDIDVVIHPKTNPYPQSRSNYSDTVNDDKGGNFGRIARIRGLMDDWVKQTSMIRLSGIEVLYWIEFLKAFSEKKDDAEKQRLIANLAKKIRRERGMNEMDLNEKELYEGLKKIAQYLM